MPLPLSPHDARRLLLAGAALLHDPATSPTPLSLVRHLAFLQLDSINVVERAHELALHARSDAYTPGQIFRPLRSAKLFEHWTHDASLIPIEHLPHWHHRFLRYRTSGWHLRRLGPDADTTIAAVLARIDRDGPLMSRDFEDTDSGGGGKGGWWNWKPAKAALEYLWRTGQLAVTDRINFQKVYNLASRTHPPTEPSPPDAHLDWACTEALTRLGVATPKELADFFAALKVADTRRWTDANLRSGRLIPVSVAGNASVTGRTSVAFHDVRRRLARLPDPPLSPDRVRFLSPFDPLLRDRARAQRLFDFTYRFEAFTPAPKRIHGYYVLPILQADRLIARADAKLDRKSSTLHLRLIPQPHHPLTRPTRTHLTDAAHRLRTFLGATHLKLSM